MARKKLNYPGTIEESRPKLPCGQPGCAGDAICRVGNLNLCRNCYVALPVDTMLALRSGHQSQPKQRHREPDEDVGCNSGEVSA